ncbi:MAG: serine hydrolase [Candidatus Aminicenantes bacterium]|nr:serine hydrolase [Candidatus Aminicenantes bacterium]
MQKILGIFIILISVFLLAGTSGHKSIIQKTDDIVQAEKKYDLFSGTILVAKDGKILYVKGIGEANKEYHIGNRLETRFNISSIQKCFIAVLIMQLNEEGKISLTDSLRKYFPECPYNSADQIQIRHLLNHTSGLGDYRKSKDYQHQADTFRTIDDILPLVYQDQPVLTPGEKFRYSNTGMLFLKAIIQKVTGMGLGEALKKRIFDPLGMDQTVLLIGGDVLSNRATGYTLSKDLVKYRRVLEEPSGYAGGGIYTTVLDLLKFDQALYREQLLGNESKNIMFTPVKPSRFYAYGWIVVPFAGTTVIYHGGMSGGFNSEFRRYPEKGYTIIVLSNYEQGAFELANKIDSMLLGEEYSLAIEAELYYRRGNFLHHRYKAYEAAYQVLLKALAPDLNKETNQRIKHRIEREINAIGYAYLAKKEYDMAIKIFESNVRHFPESVNVYDSLGDAYKKKGDRNLAIRNYKKALKVNPRQTDRQKERYNEISEKLKKLTNKK